MQLKVQAGDISTFAADAIIVNLFEGITSPGGATGAVDQALGGAISDLIAAGDLRGKQGEITLLHSMGRIASPRVIVLGLGKSEAFTPEIIRTISAELGRYLRRQRIRNLGSITHGAGIGGLQPAACAAAMAEGTLLGLYRFLEHKTGEEDADLESLTLVENDGAKLAELERGLNQGRIQAEAQNLSRDLANQPANYMTPTELGKRAEAVAQATGLQCEVYGPDWAREKGMGGLLGVAAGSDQEPRFIVLRYNGNGDAAPLALVGKGVTFDTGGISIKPAENMGDMKADMSGGAAVIAAMGAIAQLKPQINVIGVVPATENMPGGNATRPGDVLKTMLGKTIEVVNTDAEGRLILSDALTYACQEGATSIIDIATLTGAMSISLGDVGMGAMGNNDALMADVKRAAADAGEKLWELPLWQEYWDLIRSDVADMKNSGGRLAGSQTAALLLREFVDERPWVHLDIAGVDMYEREKGIYIKGSSGIPVRTLVQLVLNKASPTAAK